MSDIKLTNFNGFLSKEDRPPPDKYISQYSSFCKKIAYIEAQKGTTACWYCGMYHDVS